MSPFAIWLDTVFKSFDYAILTFWHSVAGSIGVVLTPIMEVITSTGDGGLAMIILSLILLCFAKTRKLGVCMLGAICCGALITNVTLKPLIARARPYAASLELKKFWLYVGAHIESDLSFPSGHMTTTAASMIALVYIKGKKYLYIAAPYIILMGISRNYFIVHYPTDVIGGFFAGAIGATAAFFITKLIYHCIDAHKDSKVSQFILNFDVRNLFKKAKAK